MIEEFSLGNFRSFKDVHTLNLRASKLKSKDAEIDEKNIIEVDENTRLLKLKAIYGPNASGKSNIIKGISLFLDMIRKSVKSDAILYRIDPFLLSVETEELPSFFQMVFYVEGVRYRYGFEATSKKITSEWLYGRPKVREIAYFIRENDIILSINERNFKEGHRLMSITNDEQTEPIFRSNSLFLTSVAALNGKVSKSIISMLSKTAVISGLTDKLKRDIAIKALDNENLKQLIESFLKSADVGLDNLIKYKPDESLNENLNKEFIFSKRKKFNPNDKDDLTLFSLEDESEGTIKMFEISPFILQSLMGSSALFIDEFDSRFHPHITNSIIDLFSDKLNTHSQFIFVTHDSSLLSQKKLRKDQFDFVEKNSKGESEIFSLAEIKGVRKTDLLEKEYLKGKYGAVPHISNFNLK